jgi:hypothetical protein
MVAVRMVQMAVDKVVDMVAMRHGRMAAIRAVNVFLIVAGALVVGGAAAGILCRNGNHMLFDLATVLMVQMSVVQIVDVPLVLDRGMPTSGAVLMRVAFMSSRGHDCVLHLIEQKFGSQFPRRASLGLPSY